MSELDPTRMYEARELVLDALSPSPSVAVPRIEGAVMATTSLLVARPQFWATTCLAAGYASSYAAEVGRLIATIASVGLEDVGASEPDTARMADYCASYDYLGWDRSVITQSAWMISTSLPLAVVTASGESLSDWQICIDLHGNDREKVLECYRTRRHSSAAGRSFRAEQPQSLEMEVAEEADADMEAGRGSG